MYNILLKTLNILQSNLTLLKQNSLLCLPSHNHNVGRLATRNHLLNKEVRLNWYRMEFISEGRLSHRIAQAYVPRWSNRFYYYLS